MIHDDGEYLRDPRPFDGHRVLVHRGITQPATAAASATAGSGEGDGKGEGLTDALEAARLAVKNHWAEVGGWPGGVTYDSIAEAAVRAALPAIAEEIAERISRASYGTALANLQWVRGWRAGIDKAAEIAREVGRG